MAGSIVARCALAPRGMGCPVERMTEAVTAMLGWARRNGGVAWREASLRERSALERVRERLVELELGHRFGLGEIEREGLIEEEVTLRWSTGRSYRRGTVGQVEVHEDGADDGRIGQESEDPHLSTTARAQKRQHLTTNASRRCPRARSWAQGIRANRREDGEGSAAWDREVSEGPISSSWGSGASAKSLPRRATTSARSRAFGARTP